MITILISYFYITLITCTYGDLIVSQLVLRNQTEISGEFNLILKCFVGLAWIGILFTAISILLPLGGWFPQFLLLAPCLCWWLINKSFFPQFTGALRKIFFPESRLIAILNYSCILLVLIMSASIINHPDTLMYHAQNILLIEKYKAIPGIANLYYNNGIQSSWFILSALFSFSFTGTTALSYIAPVVLIWFIQFIVEHIQKGFSDNRDSKTSTSLAWMVLLCISFWSFNQMRLTTVSASPDFIAAFYCWIIFLLFIKLKNNQSVSANLLLLLLSCFAISLKMSALPIILLPIYFLFHSKDGKSIVTVFVFAAATLLLMAPLLTRNLISSGYVLFPSSFLDIFSVDWKIPKSIIEINKDYIQAFARTGVDHNFELIQQTQRMKLPEWLPVWWSLRSLADKVVLISIPGLLILSLFLKQKEKVSKVYFFAILVSLTGILFWFIYAPDPRFGYGFLLAFGALLFNQIYVFSRRLPQRVIQILLLILSTGILSYAGYRLKYFFSTDNLFQPKGIPTSSFHTVQCGNLKLNVPNDSIFCNSIDPLCITGNCDQFEPRGEHPEDGFRAKKSADH